MRTTVDLPDEIHALARQIAHDSNRTMSEVVVDLVEAGLSRGRDETPPAARGIPQISVGRPVTGKDVRSLDDLE